MINFNSYDPTTHAASHTKRFFELWLADPQFRQELKIAPHRAVESYKLEIDPQQMRIVWDDDYRTGRYTTSMDREETEAALLAEAKPTQDFVAWMQANHNYRDRMRAESIPLEPRFRAWRQRQIARSYTEFRRAYDHNTPHVLFAVELGKGCSVGCWFCGVSAPKLNSSFLHTPENSRLLQDVFHVLERFTGVEAGGWGFLYWATDPFDNPDYEKYCLEFYNVFSRFPITTTAQPLKDPGRTHKFIKLAQEYGSTKIRFSILSLKLLARVHQEFSAEELAFVDLIPLNQGALLQKASSGRARERYARQASTENKLPGTYVDQTISCVSGFLLNMVDRSVKLITPCTSNDRWPLGYYVYDERTFSSAMDLKETLETMVERHMPLTVPPDKPLRFRGDLTFEELPDGFRVSTKHGKQTFNGNPLLEELGTLIKQGDKTPMQISQYFLERYFVDPSICSDWVSLLFRNGVLDEEPEIVTRT